MEGSFMCWKIPVSTKKWKIIVSQDHKIIPVRRDLREFLAQHPVPSRVNSDHVALVFFQLDLENPQGSKVHSLCVKAVLLVTVLMFRTLPYNQSELLFSAWNSSVCHVPPRRACPSLRINHRVVWVRRDLNNHLIPQGHVAQGSI